MVRRRRARRALRAALRAGWGALLLAGCSRGEQPHEETAALPAPPPPPAVSASSGAPNAPDTAIERGVCPFECCTYGTWRALAEIPVYAAEADSGTVAFHLRKDEPFTARTGNVHLHPVGLAVARDTLTLTPPDAAVPVRLAPGDTVEVLSPVGEGFYRIRVGGRVVEAEGFWEAMPMSRRNSAGELLRRPVGSWWVQVENREGQTGWLDMNALRGKIWGTDACAGPAPA